MYSEVNQLYVILKSLILFICFWPRCMWDPSSATRDWTHTPCIGKAELAPLDHQGSPLKKPQFKVWYSWNLGFDVTHRCMSYIYISLLLFSYQVVSDSLWPGRLPGSCVLHYLLEPVQTHVHWISDAIQPCHPLLPSSPPALSLSQHQGLFWWVDSWHQVARLSWVALHGMAHSFTELHKPLSQGEAVTHEGMCISICVRMYMIVFDILSNN